MLLLLLQTHQTHQVYDCRVCTIRAITAPHHHTVTPTTALTALACGIFQASPAGSPMCWVTLIHHKVAPKPPIDSHKNDTCSTFQKAAHAHWLIIGSNTPSVPGPLQRLLSDRLLKRAYIHTITQVYHHLAIEQTTSSW